MSADIDDMNNDGYSDIVVGNNDGIVYYAGNGLGGFSSTSRTVATSTASQFRAVAITDVNNDGNKDVIGSSFQSSPNGFISVYLGPSFTSSVSVASGLAVSAGVAAADFDRDGDMDIFAALRDNSEVDVFTNSALGTAWQAVSRISATRPLGVDVADIDGDGRIDAIAALRGNGGSIIGSVVWYQNVANNNTFVARTIATVSDPRNVVAVDLNNDGQLEVVASIVGTSQIAYFNRSGSTWTQNVIASVSGVVWVTAGDVDNDGLNDILMTMQLTGRVSWYRNLGSGAFGPEQIFATVTDGRQVIARDIGETKVCVCVCVCVCSVCVVCVCVCVLL